MNIEEDNLSNIFTPEEQEHNVERKQRLIEFVASKEAILFVGAGSSKRLCYPDWEELLQEIEKLTKKYPKKFQLHKVILKFIDDIFGNTPKYLRKLFLNNSEENHRYNLVTQLSKQVKLENKNLKNNLLVNAEEMKSHILKQKDGETEYNALFQRLFDIENKIIPYDKFHETLVSLPFKGIITTNYDKVLETALETVKPLQGTGINRSLIIRENAPWEVDKFILGLNDQNEPRRIAHLHGRYDYPESIILSSEDYQETYGIALDITPEGVNYQKIASLEFPLTNPSETNDVKILIRNLLWSIFAIQRVVFIGFSMKDPYLNALLDSVSKVLRRQDKSFHFVVMGISSISSDYSKEKAREWKENYGIETVFYEIVNNSHHGLDLLIEEIAEACGIKVKPQFDESNWQRRINQRMGWEIDNEN